MLFAIAIPLVIASLLFVLLKGRISLRLNLTITISLLSLWEILLLTISARLADPSPSDGVKLGEYSGLVAGMDRESKEYLAYLVMTGVDQEIDKTQHPLLMSWLDNGMHAGLTDEEHTRVKYLLSKGSRSGLSTDLHNELVSLIKKGISTGAQQKGVGRAHWPAQHSGSAPEPNL